MQSECDTQGVEHPQDKWEVPVFEGTRTREGIERALEVLGGRTEEDRGNAKRESEKRENRIRKEVIA